jgi:Fur family transcriptional regulator, peroxide stress response regulator
MKYIPKIAKLQAYAFLKPRVFTRKCKCFTITNMDSMHTARNTKYTVALIDHLRLVGHATNNQLLISLRSNNPDLSATTVHRITARLSQRGEIALAPKDKNGNLRYDANVEPHHHFYCECCEAIRDVDLDDSVLRSIENSLGGCRLSGQLLINGRCGKCNLDPGGAIER